MLYKKDYIDAIDLLLYKIDKLPSHIRPISILWTGNINSPGISDIDLLIGFEDDFLFANEFLFEYKKIINQIKNKEIFFLHKPGIFPVSSLKMISKFTFHDFNKMKVIHGKKFSHHHNPISKNQIIINSMEFIHSRIISFLINIYKKNINLNKLLVEGHSFIHSYEGLKSIGTQFDNTEFINFNKIENLRKKIVDGDKLQINHDELEQMYKGICLEFYYLLQNLYREFHKNVAVHYNNNINFHQYDETIILDNLAKNQVTNISLNFKNNIFIIDGFSWELKCLFDNIFYDQNESLTIFQDKNFKKSINEKKQFINNLFKFNFNNFGNSYGRSGVRPLITGKNLDRLALNSIS